MQTSAGTTVNAYPKLASDVTMTWTSPNPYGYGFGGMQFVHQTNAAVPTYWQCQAGQIYSTGSWYSGYIMETYQYSAPYWTYNYWTTSLEIGFRSCTGSMNPNTNRFVMYMISEFPYQVRSPNGLLTRHSF